MPLKIPPPPDMGRDNQKLNRWLLEIQSILNTAGLIDPGLIVGLPSNYVQTGNNTVDIKNTIDALNALENIVAVNSANIADLTARVVALEVRGEVLNGTGVPAAGLGKINDWYAHIGGGIGARIYVKTGVATWTAFPF